MKKPKTIWLFRAYKNLTDLKTDDFFFEKVFEDHAKMKTFSGKHAQKNKAKYPEYCSNYFTFELTQKQSLTGIQRMIQDAENIKQGLNDGLTHKEIEEKYNVKFD